MKALKTATKYIISCATLFGCSETAPTLQNENSTIAQSIHGYVYDQSGEKIDSAIISAYGKIVTSKNDGSFEISGLSQIPSRLQIQAYKNGYFVNYFNTQAISPLPSISITLNKKNEIASFENSTGGNYNIQNLTVNISPNTFLINPNDSVKVFANLISPDSSNFSSRMPGADFVATSQSGDTGVLTSFGAFQISYEDKNGSNINASKLIKVCTPIPLNISDSAPQTIPIWDISPLTGGTWREIGYATKVGKTYCMEISSNSLSVNCDLFSRIATISGKTCGKDESTPVSTAVNLNQILTYSNSDGYFTALVPANRSFVAKTQFGSTNILPIPPQGKISTQINCGDSTSPITTYRQRWRAIDSTIINDTSTNYPALTATNMNPWCLEPPNPIETIDSIYIPNSKEFPLASGYSRNGKTYIYTTNPKNIYYTYISSIATSSVELVNKTCTLSTHQIIHIYGTKSYWELQ